MNTHTSDFCPHCNQPRLFVKKGVNHLVHAVITLFLFGLWLPVWILAAMSSFSDQGRCTVCGSAPATFGGRSVTDRSIDAAFHKKWKRLKK